RRHRQRRHAFLLRVRVAQLSRQRTAAEDEHRAVLLLRLEEDLQPARRLHTLAQLRDQTTVLVVAGATRPTIRDATLRVDRREIERDRDVAGLEREIDAERGQDAAPDVVARRVVSKEREVTRSAPRRDAVADRLVQTERRTPCE